MPAIISEAQKEVRVAKTSHPDSQLYYFLPTQGSDYCNEDSVLGTDCGDGSIYISSSTNVIYYPHCIGDDSVSYYIGHSSLNGDTINCALTQVYSFYIPSLMPPPTKADSNSGTIKKISGFKIELIKLHCQSHKQYNFQYHFDEYVLWPVGEDEKNDFKKGLSEIRVLQKFLK